VRVFYLELLLPDLSSQLSTIRADGYSYSGFLSTPPEVVVFSRAVNMASITYPCRSITFDNPYSGTGTTAAVLENMEILVYSGNTSTLKGRLRVAAGGTSATVIQVNEFSRGHIDLADNDRFDVVRNWRVHEMLVEASSTFRKDSRITYSDQLANPAPLAIGGGPVVGFVDPSTNLLTAQWDFSSSVNVDPDSGTTKAYLHAVQDGTITSGSTTTAAITATFPVGARWTSHRVTDSSNSKQTFKYVPVIAHDWTTNPPLQCNLDSMNASRSSGDWSVRFTILAGANQSVLADGAMVIYWEVERYNGSTEASYGNPVTGRSNVKFVGYVVGDSVEQNPDTGTVSFEAISPLAVLGRIPGFSQVLNIKASPSNWRQLKGLTTNRAIIYLIRWHTTLLDVHDLILSGNNYNYPAFYVQTNTPLEQIKEIADGCDSEVTCDRTGRIIVQQDPHTATSAQRAAMTVTAALGTDDFASYQFDRDHRYENNTVEGRGFLAATTNAGAKPLLSLAPGTAPSSGVSKTQVERKIVASQSDLNDRAGRYYAKLNKLYFGLPTATGRIVLRGNYDVFDLFSEWITITIPSALNKRGLSYNTRKFVIEGIDVEHYFESTPNGEVAAKRVTLTVSEERDGVAGVTKNPPTPTKSGLPPITPITITVPYYPPPTPVGLSAGVGTIAVLGGDSRWRITSDFNAASVVYTTGTAMSILGTPIQFVADYYSPKWLTGTGAVNGWLVTSTGIYRISDIFGTVTPTLQYSFTTGTTTLRSIHIGRMTQNFLMVVSNYRASGGTVIATTVDGTNWAETTITTDYNTNTGGGVTLNAANLPSGGAVSEHPAYPGRVYVGAFTSTGASLSADSALYYADVNLSTGVVGTPVLTSLMTNELLSGAYIHFPYHNNPNNELFYWSHATAVTACTLARTRSSIQADIDAFAGAGTTAPITVVGGVVQPFDSHRLDRRQLVMAGSRVSGSSLARAIYRSRNEGATWTPLTTEATGSRWNNVQFDRDNPDVVYALGEDGKIGVFYGNTFYDKSIVTGQNMLAIVGN
jgi:hypothetical protein